jgi:AcrR family transcriptional regulator
VDAADPPSGRRERKKEQTRAALQDAARSLFAEQGFAATTVAQIADAADVSQRTFFRYFDSKEALLLPDLHELLTRIARHAAERPQQEHPLAAVLESMIAVASTRPPVLAVIGRSFDPGARPVLDPLARALLAFEEQLTAVIRTRLRAAQPCDDSTLQLRARVTANVAAAATRAALRTLRAGSDKQMTLTRAEQVLRDAFAIAQSGC